jgi:hypothetical protein
MVQVVVHVMDQRFVLNAQSGDANLGVARVSAQQVCAVLCNLSKSWQILWPVAS